jgi:mannose-1-phosphate guanylyltransferase/mannose-1-phosphate guanylyltransferase/mannose-6-phosphate isomerase
VEKPALEEAERLLADCDAAWNAGIFAFGSGTFLQELAAHRPLLASTLRQAVELGGERDGLFRPDSDSFAAIPAEAVDKAVMENSRQAVMVATDMGWSDVGTWNAVHRARDKDERGNAVSGDVRLTDCRNVIVDSEGPAVRCIGLQNMIVVADRDQILIVPLDYQGDA